MMQRAVSVLSFIRGFGGITDGLVSALMRPGWRFALCGRATKTRPAADVWVWDSCFCFGFLPHFKIRSI